MSDDQGNAGRGQRAGGGWWSWFVSDGWRSWFAGNRGWWWAGGAAAAVVLVALIVALNRGGTRPFFSPGPRFEVLVFYAEEQEPQALDLLRKNAKRVDYFSPFWYSVAADGSVQSRAEGDSLQVAKAAKLKILPLFNNLNGNDKVLTDPSARKNAVNNIAKLVRDNNYAGVNIDFQLLEAGSREGLTAFMADLKKAMPKGTLLTMSVIPVAQLRNTKEPYDYKNLAKSVDQVVLMTYDKHAEWSGPGPVAPIDWLRESVRVALNEGFRRDQLLLGVATYGYDWAPGQKTATMPMRLIATESNEKHEYDKTTESSYYRYTDNQGKQHEVWYEDERTLVPKVRLAQSMGLRGIAVWRAGYEDQQWWDTLGKLLKR